MRRIALLLAALLLAPLFGAEAADAAASECTADSAVFIEGAIGEPGFLTDAFVETHVRVSPAGALTVEVPPDASRLVLSWYQLPASVTLEQRDSSGASLDSALHVPFALNETLPLLSGCRSIRITGEGGFLLSGLRVFTDGALPSDVEDWTAPDGFAPLMLAAADASAALPALLGLIPETVDRGIGTQLVLLTPGSRAEQQELLAALWRIGMRRYPVFGAFPALDDASEPETAGAWGYTPLRAFLVRALRTFRPSVVLSGAPERGTDAFLLRQLRTAMLRAADPAEFPQSAALGAWQARKLYCVDPLGTTVPDWSRALPAYRGATAREAAAYAYSLLHTARVLCPEPPALPAFRLVVSFVGADEQKNNLFEHTGVAGDAPANAPIPVPTAAPLPTPTPTPAPGKPIAVDTLQGDGFRRPFDPVEFVSADAEHSHWEYRSDTLSVLIDEYESGASAAPLTYFLIEVRQRTLDARVPAFASAQRDGVSRIRARALAHTMQAVLMVSGDGLLTGPRPAGPVLRAGRIYSDATEQAVLALMPGGGLTVVLPNQATAEALLAMGVSNTFCHGPWLLHEGMRNPDAEQHPAAGDRARVAIGMAEPNHYFLLVTDGGGTQKAESLLVSELASILSDAGCTEAYQLASGENVNLFFLGESLNGTTRWRDGRITNTSGDIFIADGLLFGRSQLVPKSAAKLCDFLGLTPE